MAKTVKVRIAVAVSRETTADGIPACECCIDYGDNDAAEKARTWLAEAGYLLASECTVTAELPVPEPLEVAGVVEGEDAETDAAIAYARSVADSLRGGKTNA